MKIISKYQDYYDYASMFMQDSSIVYKRQLTVHELHTKDRSLLESLRRASISHTVSLRYLYPVYIQIYDRIYPFTYIHYDYNREGCFLYGIDDVVATIAQHLTEDLTDPRLTRVQKKATRKILMVLEKRHYLSTPSYSPLYTHLHNLDRYHTHGETVWNKDALQRIDEYEAPILLYSSYGSFYDDTIVTSRPDDYHEFFGYKTSKPPFVYRNPMLKHPWNLADILEPHSCYQLVTQAMDRLLYPQQAPVTLDDNKLLEKHGFDKKISFRHPVK